jgi:hypothetical protein
MGAAGQCPNNDCGPRTGSNGNLYPIVLTREGFSYINPLNGDQFDDGSELGLPDLNNPFGGLPVPTGQGGGSSTGCPTKILNAVNNHFGTSIPSANIGTGQFAPFPWPRVPGGTINIDVFGMHPGISPGRYPVNWWTYIIGVGSTIHIPAGPGGADSPQTLIFSSSHFTVHLDSAFPYNPFGLAFHVFHDMLRVGGLSPCP